MDLSHPMDCLEVSQPVPENSGDINTITSQKMRKFEGGSSVQFSSGAINKSTYDVLVFAAI